MSFLKKRYLLILMCLVILIIILTQCRQQGCKDINAVNYDTDAKINDGFCSYRFLSGIGIIKVSLSINWDTTVNPAPDLKFYLKPSSYVNWEYETPVAFDNTIYPYLWDIKPSGNKYLLWKEEYTFLLADEDQVGRDTIFNGTFIPSEVYNDDKIILKNENETTEIELGFVIF